MQQLDTDQPLRLGPMHYLRMRVTADFIRTAERVEEFSASLIAATAWLQYLKVVYPKV